MKYYKLIFSLLLILPFLSVFSSSCSKNGDSPDEPGKDDKDLKKITVLLYAVVSDLNLESDKAEILEGVKDIDLATHSLFVYQVYKTGLPQLLELTYNLEGIPEFQVIKVYDRSLYSTDPERISMVIDDVIQMNPAEDYGLIFWSHGTGWTPKFSDHGITTDDDINTKSIPMVYAFGADLDLERDPSHTDYTDIDELAAAIPDHTFRYIWFDVCYMGGIELAYQFRNKCEYYIGMPTEDAGNGMPYQYTMKYLLKSDPDCISAAKEFFRYYESGEDGDWAVATVGVYNLKAIEPVADYCRSAYKDAETPSSYGLQYYSRGSNGPFYDFGQYTKRIASSNDYAPAEEEFQKAMEDFVIYKAATEKNFSGQVIIQENFSGVSCHLLNRNAEDKKTTYYKTLDWYKRVYE